MKSEAQVEFFRHLRPTWFDRRRLEVVPARAGGVSFMLVPTAERQYDFWVNICPLGVTFSKLHAVTALRQVRRAGVAPAGSVLLDGRPIMAQLVETVITNYPPPFELGKLAAQLAQLNEVVEREATRFRHLNAIANYADA